MIERLYQKENSIASTLGLTMIKVNEIIELVNKLPVMIQGHRWQESLNAEKGERCPDCGINGHVNCATHGKPYKECGKPSTSGMGEVSEIIEFLSDRLIHRYGENPNVDYLIKAHAIAERMR